tara:strand:- start:724 stop:1173 length:450 start_codon:yes stop_codon:yes gene_type:complete
MARKSKAKFKMEGHALPGINQKSETANLKDGRSPSSAFQMKASTDSPNKLVGLAALGAGAALGRTKWGKNAMDKIGGSIKNIGSKLFGGGGGNEDAEAGKELLKEEAKEEMAGDTAMAMKSPTKKKLKTGTKTTVGGKLNEGTSPHQKL